MNKQQQLFVSAFNAASAAQTTDNAHAAATATLQAFTTAGHDPQDYGQWQAFYTQFKQQFRHCSFQKTPSELQAERVAKAAAAEAAKNKPPVAAPAAAPAPTAPPA